MTIKTNADLLEAIRTVVGYNYSAEERDYKEQRAMGESGTGHIFLTLKALDKWAGEGG